MSFRLLSHRPVASAVALLLLISACGSSTDEATDTTDSGAVAAGSDTTVATDDAATDDAATEDAATDDPSAEEDASALPPTPVEDIVAGFGLDPTPELLSCLEDRGVGAEVDTNAGVGLITSSLMGCAPEEMGAFMAEGLTVPGLDAEQVQCVVTETARAVGDLSEEEATAAFEEPEMPEGLRNTVVEKAAPACDLSEEQVLSVLDTQS